MKKQSLLILIALTALLAGCESTQQKAYDLKADTVGTHRVVEVFTEAGTKVATIEDKKCAMNWSVNAPFAYGSGIKTKRSWSAT